MSAAGPIQFQVRVADAERQGIVAGVQQLFSCLYEVAGDREWLAQVKFEPPQEPMTPIPGLSAIVLSLLPDAELLDETIAATEARWHALIPALLEPGVPIYLCTVFRHVAERWSDEREALRLERIRRLNRMAADLSLTYGIAVIDIDRALAHVGGDILETDWRLKGFWAAEASGHTMAWSMLSYGLDEIIEPEIQEQARAALGDLSEINALLLKRLALRNAEEPAG